MSQATDKSLYFAGWPITTTGVLDLDPPGTKLSVAAIYGALT